ncbi:MAG: DNA recombination protein RmuC, partial [Pseudomonadota bacterium]|nr:DNA recombination protein RmuC [Pseudomonadota bacterium]
MLLDWLTPALLALVLGVLLWIALRRNDAGAVAERQRLLDAIRLDIGRFESGLREELQGSASATRQELGRSIGEFQRTLLTQQGDARAGLDLALSRSAEQQATSLREFGAAQAERLGALASSNDERLREVRATVEARLSSLQLDNEKKLEQIRNTVDEKLHDTLERRLGENFRQVAERLEQVHLGLGEMRNMARDVGSLNRVLTNVKTRGTFGEWQLGALLEDILQIEQYAKNVETSPGTGARVEFAIKMPGRADAVPAWLPVDAKFPRDDYERLLDAQERADAVGVATAAKAIDQRLRIEARGIREKYLAPPHTTDYAILF